jgi:cold shock CspA family protein
MTTMQKKRNGFIHKRGSLIYAIDEKTLGAYRVITLPFQSIYSLGDIVTFDIEGELAVDVVHVVYFGKVSSLKRKGYGFIAIDHFLIGGRKEIFFHRNKTDETYDPKTGDAVKFTIGHDRKNSGSFEARQVVQISQNIKNF